MIIYKIVKQIPSDDDTYHVKYHKDSDTYYIGKDGKIIVIESSDDEENEKRKMRKRKNKESIDEINQVEKKRRKNTRYPPRKK